MADLIETERLILRPLRLDDPISCRSHSRGDGRTNGMMIFRGPGVWLMAVIVAPACVSNGTSKGSGAMDGSTQDAAVDRGGETGGSGAGGLGGKGSGGADGGSTGRACAGHAAPPAVATNGDCRTQSDCNIDGQFRGYYCRSSPFTGCGANFQPMIGCKTDADCAALNRVCVTASTTQPCTAGPDVLCADRCTATSCKAGERCASSGHCEIYPCAEGFVCGSGLTCAPTRTGADANGCASSSCATDGFTCTGASHCDASAASKDAHGCALDQCATGAFSCAADQICQSPGDGHGCRCASNATCSVNQRCDPTTGACIAQHCSVDSDCDCGACVLNACQPTLWHCYAQPV
jgi:hypothetical protein